MALIHHPLCHRHDDGAEDGADDGLWAPRRGAPGGGGAAAGADPAPAEAAGGRGHAAAGVRGPGPAPPPLPVALTLGAHRAALSEECAHTQTHMQNIFENTVVVQNSH